MELPLLRVGVYTFTIQAVGQPTRYVTHVIFIYKLWLSIQVLSILGHHDPSSGKPLGHISRSCIEEHNSYGLSINRSQKVEQVFTKRHKTCSMAWQIKEFLLSYYKKLQSGSNCIIVFWHWHTISGKLATGLCFFVWTIWRLRVIWCNHFFFIPPQTLKSTVDQSIPVKAWKTASSWIRMEGLMSGA